MRTEEMIRIFTALRTICTVMTAAGFCFAGFAFFRFRIPAVFARMAESRKEKTHAKKKKRRPFVITGEKIIVHTDERI